MSGLPQATPSSRAAAPSPVRTSAVLVKSIVLIGMAVLVGVLFKATPLKGWLSGDGQVAVWVRSLGFWGVALFVFASAVLIMVGVPRVALCFLAGALYGFWGGLTVITTGTILCYYSAFLWIRGRRETGVESAPLPKGLGFLQGDPGFSGVVLARLLPGPGMVITLGLSLSNVSHRAYLAGSVIGSFPHAVLAVLAGALGKDLGNWSRLLVPALISIFAVWFIVNRVAKRAKSVQRN